MSTDMSNNKRVIGLDLIKILAAFFIVLYHLGRVDFGFIEDVIYYPTITKCLWSFCVSGVPLFFMVNGALTINKYNTRKTFEKVGRLIFVAVFWTLIFKVAFVDFTLHHTFDKSLFNFKDYYWFFYTLALLYVIDWILQRCPRWIEIVLFVMIMIFPFVTNFIWDIIIFINKDVSIPSWGHTGVFTIYAFLYHRLGYHLINVKFPKWLCCTLILLGLCLTIFEVYVMTNHNNKLWDGVNSNFPTIGALCLTLGLFQIIKQIRINNEDLRKIIYSIGSSALGIYLFHLPILTMVHIIIQCNINPLLALLLALLIVFVTAIMTKLLAKSPFRFTVKL